MGNDEMKDSLDELREEGRFEGEGSFTVNVARAGSSLKEFLLEQPRAYVLNVFAHAVASGATELDVYTDMDDFKLTHNGEALKAEDLECLGLLAVDRNGLGTRATMLSELSVGLHVAQALKPKWITVSSGGYRWKISPDGESLEPHEESAGKTTIHVKEAISLRSFFKGRSVEAALLIDRCSYAPIQMTLNKENLRRDWVPRGTLIGEWLALDGLPDPSRFKSSFELPPLESSHAEYGGLVYLDRKAREAQTAITVVLNGVSFQQTVDIGWPGSGAIIFCSHLSKDLSQSALVRDEAFLGLVGFVKQRLEQMAGVAALQWDALSSDTQKSRWDILERSVNTHEAAGNWEKVVALRKQMVKFFMTQKGPGHPDTRSHRQRLAQALVENGQIGEGVECLLKEADACEKASDFLGQLNCLSRVRELSESGFDLPNSEMLQILKGLALAQARGGLIEESEDTLILLAKRLESEPDGEETLRRLKLELGVIAPERSRVTLACALCGSSRMMKDCAVFGSKGIPVRVRVGQPTSLWSSELDALLIANICGDCGNVSFRVDNPKELWNKKHR